VCCAIVALFLCGTALAQSQPPSPSASHSAQTQQSATGRKNQDPKASNADTQAPPPSTNQPERSPNPGHQKKHNEDGENAATQYNIASWVVAVFTVVLAISAIVQVGIYIRQTELMASALEETKRTASAAIASATAMEHGNAINRESLQAVQRAYVGFPYASVTNVNIGCLTHEDTGAVAIWRIQLPIENTGNTPAREFRTCVNFIKTDTAGLPKNFSFKDFGDIATAGSIGAKDKIFSPDMDIPIETIYNVRDKQIRGFFYGWATYRDVFENTPVHRTEFCHELHVLNVAGTELLFRVASHGEHNSQT
jgi:hypothetical protein